MRRIWVAAFAGFVLATAAGAESARLTGLPAALLGGVAAEGTQHELPTPPITSITAGKLAITLGQTTLSDVVAAFGGTIASATDGPAAAAWLCYAFDDSAGPAIAWFVSNGDDAGGKVNLVGANLQSADPAKQNCPQPTAAMALDFSVPGLGASEADLKAIFSVVDPRAGFVAYSSQQGEKIQNVNYLIRDGKVAGLAATWIDAP